MHSEKDFKIAFTLSILTHVLAMIPLSTFSILPKPQTLADTEITYLNIASKDTVLVKKASKNPSPLDLEKIELKQKIILSNDDKIPAKKSPGGQRLEQKNLFIKTNASLQKPNTPWAELIPRNDIKLSLNDSSKAQSNPVYLTYRNFLHENLRRYLYDRYSDSTERGEVYLTFILNADGSVRQAQVIDAKSSAANTLKRIVIESLYDAAPFPPLPQALNSPIMSFSVTIRFKEREIE